MTPIQTRLQENFPTIQMTLVSLIVALVYENLVGAVSDHEGGSAVTPENYLFWSQCGFLTLTPLMYWFTLSLQTASIRAIFSPRDALLPIAPGIAFIILASTVGEGSGVSWIATAGVLFATGWFAFQEYGRLYEADPDAPGGIGAHQFSARIMFGIALILGVNALLLQTHAIGLIVSSISLWAATLLGVYAHVRWYSEWSHAVGMKHAKTAF